MTIDCPNCGQQVDDGAAVCSNCGFDIHSQQADEVRRLREEGKIHPGRLGAANNDWEGGDPRERDIHEELPAEDWGAGRESPEERDAGL
jgi:transcription initiation factor TFIIIB Brf1 subunit/transcription initiation factor TFIIB